MAKQQILLVDADSSSARLLEVSLRSAGFTVATADSAEAALATLEHGTPDLILTDTALPKADGFSFVRKLRSRPESAAVPVVFLTEQGALEDKLRGLELGVDDYLAKPIFVREVVTRVQLLLARKRQRIAPEPARTRFSGSLEDVAVVDLLQTIAVSGKSGVASVRRGDREAWLYFDRGQVIDAEVGDLRGEEAVYRTISWTTGSFDLEFRSCDRAKVIDAPYQALLMEGLRRVDELGRIAEQLPPEDAVIDLDHAALASRLNEIPDELNAILRLIDGKRTLLDLIDASPFDDLSTLTVLSKFYFEGLISSADPLMEGSERPLAASGTSSAPPSDAPSDVARSDAPPGDVARSDAPPSDAPPSDAPSSDAPRGVEPPELAARDVGQIETLVPPSRSTPAAALPTVPPVRLPQTSPPSTVPAELEPPREARRETPAPVTARAAAPAPVIEGKLTPKGIVNVGEHGSIPAKPQSSFHVVAPQRRSPIPMPDASLRLTDAARTGALQASGAEAEELRQTRTSLGLSAAPLQRPSITRAPLEAEPAAEPERTHGPGASAAPVTVAAAAPAAPPSVAAAPAAAAGAPPAAAAPGSATSSAPTARKERAADGAAAGSKLESEDEFFEAGDEGTYEGGPLSDVPELRLDHESAPAPPRAPRRPSPVRAERARRGKVVVGAVLALASAPLLIGLAQRLASRADAPPPVAEPTGTSTAAPAEPPPSVPTVTATQPLPAPVDAPPAATTPAAPSAPAAPPAAVAAPPSPSTAAPAAPAPAAPSAAPPAPSPPAPVAPSATAPPPRPAAPKPAVSQPAPATPPRAAPAAPSDAPTPPRATQPPPRAAQPPPRATKPAQAAPAPPAPTRPAALPPLDIPVAPQLPKAGEKPPTAAFPVQ